MTQFYSRNDVNYSGDVYSIPFDYIDKKEVKVYIDDELWTKWHFLAKHQLTLDEVPAEIGYNNIISVRRETDIAEKVVTYDNNSLLNKENLNKSQDQLLYAVQEIYDNNVQFQSDIREEVDEKVERVSDAVEKLEFLEDSVEIANEAALEATEQAQIATEKAEETLNTYNEAMVEIDTLRQDSIDEVNQLVADHTDDLNALDRLIKKDADAIINRVGLNMFDTVVKDHILTYEESKGLALHGTWVYKDAIAGERYGYPDFYNKCLEEYKDSENQKQWLKSNITKIGSLTDNEGVLSGFSASNYAYIPNGKQYNNAEYVFKFTTGEAPTATQCIFHSEYLINIELLADGYISSYNWGSKTTGAKLVQTTPNTTYWVKAIINNNTKTFTYSTDGKTYLGEISFTDSGMNFSTDYQARFGLNSASNNAQFLGSVDLNGCYINVNGERWWDGVDYFNYKQHANGHAYYDIQHKSLYDALCTHVGISRYYGIDIINERVLLPYPTERILIAKKEPTETDASWYNLYSDGWCEQGGAFQPTASTLNTTGSNVSLLKTYKDKNYCLITAQKSNSGSAISAVNFGYIVSPSVISMCYYGSTATNAKIQWRTCGYADEQVSTNTYSYICVGNTVSDTSWIDVVTQVQQGTKDIESTKNVCLEEIELRGAELRSKMGLSMFDTILKDHVLSYEESKGLALQGTYVYKNAIAGSRYGYKDFYTKCLQEYKESENNQHWLKSNVNYVSSVVDNQGILSGFTTSNYATLPDILNTSQAWECSLKCKITTPATTQYWFNSGGQFKYAFLVGVVSNKFSIHASSNGSSWDIASNKLGTHTTVADTYYYLKFGFNGSEYYLDYSLTGKDTDYTRDISIPSTAIIYQTTQSPNIGCGWESAPFLSSVDLHASSLKLNNSYIWKGVEYCTKHTNGHLFYDISQKDKVDEVFNTYGMAWLYGVDEENERIFLPRNIWFEQMSMDDVGKAIEAGLPNITGAIHFSGIDGWAGSETAFYHTLGTGAGRSHNGNSGNCDVWFRFDASRSSKVYSKSNTVQPNAVKKLLYICVGTTEVQNVVTDVVDVTTTENDTAPLFTGQYFDFKPNNLSWLKGGEQANNSGIYTFTYNELVNELTYPKYNLKVVDESNMISGVDYSAYWKVNQDEMYFKTPSIAGLFPNNRILVAKKEPTGDDATWYNLYSDGWCEQGGTWGVNSSNWAEASAAYPKEYKDMSYQLFVQGNWNSADSSSCKVTTRTTTGFTGTYANNLYSVMPSYWRTCGYVEIPTVSEYTENVNLYFKVANAVQNLELLNAGEVLEAVADVSANLIPNNKEMIMGYVVPDRVNAITYTITQGATINFPDNGWAILSVSGNATFSMDVKGAVSSYANSLYRWGRASEPYRLPWFPVAKGEYSIFEATSVDCIYFVPMKGTN